MSSAIFNAIGRGYSARSILGNIGRRFPEYAHNINTAYYAGYAGNQILSKIAGKKDGREYDPELFKTEFERTRDSEDRKRKYFLMASIGAAGTAGAGLFALYKYLDRNQAKLPDEIILPNQKLSGKKSVKSPYTIHQQRPQIGYDQKKIENRKEEQKYLPNRQLRIGYEDENYPEGPTQPNEPEPPPYKNVPSNVMQPSYPLTPQGKEIPPILPQNTEKPYLKSFKALEALGEATRIVNLIEGGMTPEEIELTWPMMVKKQVADVAKKAEGGIEKLVKDMMEYVKENPRPKKDFKNEVPEIKTNTNQNIIENVTLKQNEQLPQPNIPTNAVQPQQVQPIQEVAPMRLPPEQRIEQPEITPPTPAKKMVQLPNGKIGELEDVKHAVATVNVDGKIVKEKANAIKEGPQDLEDAVRQVVNSIPEELKSTAMQTMVHIPGENVMLTQFYDGKWAWYLDVSPELYRSIALGTYTPKGQGITGIAEYSPAVADSRGAGFHKEIVTNPLYSKENKGKTWGYADNEYSLLSKVQPIIHKISKEKYDKEGNLIQPKSKKESGVLKKEPVKHDNSDKNEEMPLKKMTNKEAKAETDRVFQKPNPKNNVKLQETNKNLASSVTESKINELKRQDISKQGLKSQKDFILERIDHAISAPSHYFEKKDILLHVPGDGEFKIKNNEKALKHFYNQVKNKWPDKPYKPKEDNKYRDYKPYEFKN